MILGNLLLGFVPPVKTALPPAGGNTVQAYVSVDAAPVNVTLVDDPLVPSKVSVWLSPQSDTSGESVATGVVCTTMVCVTDLVAQAVLAASLMFKVTV